jgi:hypothetical protein
MKKQIRKFVVDAARTTGEWLESPQDTGEVVDFSEWCKMDDTDDKHFDHFENFEGGEDGEICAIEVTWID